MFLNEADDFTVISANSLFKHGKRHNVVRNFGVAKNERENFRFDVCAPSDDCPSGFGYIELCFLANVSYPQHKGNCPEHFSSFKVEFVKEKIDTTGEIDIYFRIIGTYTYEYESDRTSNEPKKMRFYRKNITCLTAYHEINYKYKSGWKKETLPQFRFAQPEDTYHSAALYSDPWGSVPFDNEIHPFQTIVILRDASSMCAPSIYVNLPEYVRIETSKPVITTKATTVKTTTTTLPSTTIQENTTKAVDGFMSPNEWIPMLIVAAILLLLIPQLVIGSIILNRKSSRKANKLYLMVLEKRQEIRNEILQNQKEALEEEKKETAKKSKERKRKIEKMKKELKAKLPGKNPKNKGINQTPKNSMTGSSKIGKREVLQKNENIGDVILVNGARKKEKGESNIKLVKDDNSKTGSISTKMSVSQKQSFSAFKKNN